MAKPLENKGKKGEFRRVALRFMTIRKPSAKQRGNISCRAENFRGEFSQRVFRFAAKCRSYFARFTGFKQTNSRNRADCRPAGQFRRTVLPANRFPTAGRIPQLKTGQTAETQAQARPNRTGKTRRTNTLQKTGSNLPETETGAAETFAEPFAAALFRAALFPAAAPVTDTTFPPLRETTESHASTKPAS